MMNERNKPLPAFGSDLLVETVFDGEFRDLVSLELFDRHFASVELRISMM